MTPGERAEALVAQFGIRDVQDLDIEAIACDRGVSVEKQNLSGCEATHATEFRLGDNIPQQRHDPAPHIWGRWEEWEDKPVISGTDDGVPNRVDRIAAIGNAIVPQVAYELLRVMTPN